MNPPTPGPLTVLLVPPPGDTALLADECGGRVPTLDIHVTADGSPGWTLPTPYTVTPVKDLPPTEARGLLLVHEGAPVAMGIDRAARTLTARTVAHVMSTGTGAIRAFSVHNHYKVERREGVFGPWGVLDLCDAWVAEGARVVLLRDGREVGS